jgi:predicted MFS family arabinose efflux permease
MPQTPRSSANWYALGILFLVFFCNYVDRSVLSILQVPIKKALGLSDSQLGLLAGLAFTLFYATAALPIARLSDRFPRTWVLAGSLALWSVMTVCCGFATSFASLLAYRVGVAAGEGGGAPPSVSLITDYFSPEKRGTALGFYLASAPVGGMVGFAAGGWLNSALGWREAFFWVGGLGMLLLPLLLFTLREPVRGRDRYAIDDAQPPAFWRSVRILWEIKTFRYAAFGSAAALFLQFAFTAWSASFYTRAFHMPLSRVAGPLALVIGVGGVTGALGGGFLSDRLGRKWVQAYMLVPAAAMVLVIPFGLAQLLVPKFAVSVALEVFTVMMMYVYVAPHVAMSQRIVPPVMRAFAQACQTLVVVVLGGGLGPMVVGMASDRFLAHGGDQSLRWALAASLLAAPLGLISFLMANASVAADVAAARLGRWPTDFSMTLKGD